MKRIKRLSALLILVVFLLPVLAVAASADTVSDTDGYVFERYYPPATMSEDDSSDVVMDANSVDFVCDGYIPDGLYSASLISVDGSSSAPVLPFFLSFVTGGVPLHSGLLGSTSVLTMSVGGQNGLVIGSFVHAVGDCTRLTFTNAVLDSTIPDEGILTDLDQTFSSIVLTPVESGGLEAMMDGLSTASAFVHGVSDIINENPLLAAFFAAALIGVVIPIVIQLKKAAK